MTEGHKMWLSVMAVFLVYAIVFILFEDYDRKFIMPFNEVSDWHLLLFSLIVMSGLGFLLYRYAKRMDERISREQAEKENRMRRELTQNIAHELKTPVASILGYTETIMQSPDIAEDVKNQFITRTNEQAQRLTTLLHDISTLNRMDYAKDMIPMERVDVSVLIADIIEETSFAMESRQMTIKNYLPQNIIIHGSSSLLYSIFRNLTDNSINYAGNGTTIEINATQQSDSWRFTFKDNGIGIPSEHLSRIFERFYRIDKGRSRDMGGTGLGLSIVKNAVLLHGGNIEVSTPETGGLMFEFTLKR
jgi:two-component system OmpR family sensor kinase/two-component system phosphate regulon sensor histidine kinase PhoR